MKKALRDDGFQFLSQGDKMLDEIIFPGELDSNTKWKGLDGRRRTEITRLTRAQTGYSGRSAGRSPRCAVQVRGGIRL